LEQVKQKIYFVKTKEKREGALEPNLVRSFLRACEHFRLFHLLWSHASSSVKTLLWFPTTLFSSPSFWLSPHEEGRVLAEGECSAARVCGFTVSGQVIQAFYFLFLSSFIPNRVLLSVTIIGGTTWAAFEGGKYFPG